MELPVISCRSVSCSQLKDFFQSIQNYYLFQFSWPVAHLFVLFPVTSPLEARMSNHIVFLWRVLCQPVYISQNLMNCVPCVTSLYLTYSPRSTAILVSSQHFLLSYPSRPMLRTAAALLPPTNTYATHIHTVRSRPPLLPPPLFSTSESAHTLPGQARLRPSSSTLLARFRWLPIVGLFAPAWVKTRD